LATQLTATVDANLEGFTVIGMVLAISIAASAVLGVLVYFFYKHCYTQEIKDNEDKSESLLSTCNPCSKRKAEDEESDIIVWRQSSSEGVV
jgi:hypothetical protein